MSWEKGTISLSNLVWYRKCRRSFDLSMKRVEQVKHPNVKNAARFGQEAEGFWDKVFSQNWFAMDNDDEIESRKDYFLKTLPNAQDAAKIEKGFWGCFKSLQQILDPYYKLTPQKYYKVPLGVYSSTGRLDYLLNEGGQRPIIIDAKGTSKKDPDNIVGPQLQHYAWFYWLDHGVVPETYAFYLRLGVVQRIEIDNDAIQAYDEWVRKEYKQIEAVKLLEDFPAVANKSCFICGYKSGCPAYKDPSKEARERNKTILRDSFLAESLD